MKRSESSGGNTTGTEHERWNWQAHCASIERSSPGSTNFRFTCKYCCSTGTVMTGGSTRMKEHLVGSSRGSKHVQKCSGVPADVLEALRARSDLSKVRLVASLAMKGLQQVTTGIEEAGVDPQASVQAMGRAQPVDSGGLSCVSVLFPHESCRGCSRSS
jgi:hypothetical protein